MTHLGDVAACTRLLSEQVQQILKDGRCVVTLGGDHSVGIGTIDGHVKVCFKKTICFQRVTYNRHYIHFLLL